ncbi:Oidioi.mRNA.OKI2018_I69.PAR.g12201.t1.cds [Oikopleura dioica]|uniref:Oidioi.mRNA.OKI2018_I69.PAR.g12201.t1.cds n=1 Tax=Oikopleura dioica TaxID=34765 RepID=A0ABN7S3V6_OIKDI|nr:Oidioi.mRNA.OKI2018_I69.PAR.g12201.t1.cds [Oikopleura dioica]
MSSTSMATQTSAPATETGTISDTDSEDSFNARSDPNQFFPPGYQRNVALTDQDSGSDSDDQAIRESDDEGDNQDWNRRTDTLFASAEEEAEAKERSARIAKEMEERQGQPLSDIIEESESRSLERMAQKEEAEAQRRTQKARIDRLKQEAEAEAQRAADKARAKEALKIQMKRQLDENTRIRREYAEQIQREKEAKEAQERRMARDKEAEEKRLAAIKAAEEKVLTEPRIGIRLVAETGAKGNYYYLSKKESKLMERSAVRDMLDNRSISNFNEVKQAWFSSTGLQKFKDSRLPGHRHYKYNNRSSWEIKEGTTEWRLDPIDYLTKEERAVIHYVVEFLNYEGIKRRFKEAIDSGLLKPKKLDVILLFAYKICGSNLVHYMRFIFVRLYKLHEIPIPPVHSDAAPRPPRY